MNGFYCQLEAIRFQQLEALKCDTCQYFSQRSVQIQMSCPSNVCTISDKLTPALGMTNHLLNIFMSLCVHRYCWLIKHRKYGYSDIFSTFRNFTIFKPSQRFPGWKGGHCRMGKHISLAQWFLWLTAGDIISYFWGFQKNVILKVNWTSHTYSMCRHWSKYILYHKNCMYSSSLWGRKEGGTM